MIGLNTIQIYLLIVYVHLCMCVYVEKVLDLVSKSKVPLSDRLIYGANDVNVIFFCRPWLRGVSSGKYYDQPRLRSPTHVRYPLDQVGFRAPLRSRSKKCQSSPGFEPGTLSSKAMRVTT